MLLLIIILALGSCTDLNKLPEDQITNDQYWNSANDMKLYVNHLYPRFIRQFSYWSPDMYYRDGNSDNMAPISDISINNDWIAGLNTPNSGDYSWNKWYHYIRTVNIFFKNVNQNKSDLLSTSDGKQYYGEARFFRAYFYFQLVRLYGAVPYVSKPLTTDDTKELQSARTPRNQVMDSVIADLDDAINNLKPRSDMGINRINKETALLYKSYVALFEGTWEKYHKGDPFEAKSPNSQKYLQSAAQAGKSLIDMGTASLAPSYPKLFNQDDLNGNPEVLLERQYSADLDLSSMIQRRIARHGGGTGLTKALVESYLCKDGKPNAVSPQYQGDSSIKDVVANRDPRLADILKVPGDTMYVNSDGSPHVFQKPRLSGGGVLPTTTGYELEKGDQPDQPIPPTGGQGAALPLFRYAEGLLDYAEAKAELGTITQQDLDISINKLRDRVNMPHLMLNNITPDPNWDYPNLSPIINEVRRERRVEMAAEGLRRRDIFRWAAADEILVNHVPLGFKFPQSEYPNITPGQDIYLNQNGYVEPYKNKFPNGAYGFKPGRDYLLPIPTKQMTLDPNLTQNPGW